MEAFSLLKYWRGGGAGVLNTGGRGGGGPDSAAANARSTTIVTAVAQNNAVETDDDDDDGPFFDLEFAVPDDEEDDEEEAEYKDGEHGNQEDNASICAEEGDDEEESDDGGESREFKFTLSSSGSRSSGGNDRMDPNLPLSPSDDLFFKGRLVPIEPSSLSLGGSEPNSKPAQFPVSLLKSATKFRVLMLGFKRSKQVSTEKTEKTEPNRSTSSSVSPKQAAAPPPQQEAESKEKKFFTVKFKVEEVPIMSLFTRDNSSASRSSSANKSAAAAQKQSSEESASDEKRFSKDVMQKYLRKVKPLYIRVSRRYGEKLRFSGQLNIGSSATAKPSNTQKPPPQKPAAPAEKPQPPVAETTEPPAAPPVGNGKSQKQGNLPAGLRVVCKHLGKSRSASSAVAAAPPGPVLSKRRDDSLLQQQDGIQSAILHCKRSFNASRDSESSLLPPRSVSETSNEKPVEKSTKSLKEAKEN